MCIEICGDHQLFNELCNTLFCVVGNERDLYSVFGERPYPLDNRLVRLFLLVGSKRVVNVAEKGFDSVLL